MQNKINHESAITKYENFNKLTNNEKNMFYKGIFAVIVRGDTIIKGKKRQKLANEYSFKGIKICNIAFLIIYSIRTKA